MMAYVRLMVHEIRRVVHRSDATSAKIRSVNQRTHQLGLRSRSLLACQIEIEMVRIRSDNTRLLAGVTIFVRKHWKH